MYERSLVNEIQRKKSLTSLFQSPYLCENNSYFYFRTSPLLRLGVNTRLDILQEQESLQFAAFKSGGGVVFVSRNDIYYLDAIPDGQVHRITSSGAAGTVYNGVADWLYEGQ